MYAVASVRLVLRQVYLDIQSKLNQSEDKKGSLLFDEPTPQRKTKKET